MAAGAVLTQCEDGSHCSRVANKEARRIDEHGGSRVVNKGTSRVASDGDSRVVYGYDARIVDGERGVVGNISEVV